MNARSDPRDRSGRLSFPLVSCIRKAHKKGPHAELPELAEFSRAARRALDCFTQWGAAAVSVRGSGGERSGLPERPRERDGDGMRQGAIRV
jgi:hypothetical protein